MSENKDYIKTPNLNSCDSYDELMKVPPISLEDTVDAVDTARQEQQRSAEDDGNTNSQVKSSKSTLAKSGASLCANVSRIKS